MIGNGDTSLARPRARALTASVAVGALASDLDLVRAHIAPGERLDIAAHSALTHGVRSGIASSFFAEHPDYMVAVVVYAVLGLAVAAWDVSNDFAAVGAGLLLGGALGNALDPVGDRHVTDVLDIDPWPAFNLADLAITCGLVVWILSRFRRRDRGQQELR